VDHNTPPPERLEIGPLAGWAEPSCLTGSRYRPIPQRRRRVQVKLHSPDGDDLREATYAREQRVAGLAQQPKTYVGEQSEPNALNREDGQEDFHVRSAPHRPIFPSRCERCRRASRNYGRLTEGLHNSGGESGFRASSHVGSEE